MGSTLLVPLNLMVYWFSILHRYEFKVSILSRVWDKLFLNRAGLDWAKLVSICPTIIPNGDHPTLPLAQQIMIQPVAPICPYISQNRR